MESLLANFLVALLVVSASSVDDKALPDKFQFPRVVETPPFRVEPKLVDGQKPKPREGKMIVDGVVTTAAWPGHLPRPGIYKISDRFFLIHDAYHGKDFVWDRRKKEFRGIGRFGLVSTTTLGVVCFRHDPTTKPQTFEVVDFDTTNGRPRVLYRGSTSGLIGEWKSGLLLYKSETSAVSLRPGKPPGEVTFDLRGFRFASYDSIRGNLALLKKTNPAVLSPSSKPYAPYDVEVAILDLRTIRVKTVGSFPGGWRAGGAVHPSYFLSWITPERAKLRHRKDAQTFEHLYGTSAYVVEGTETLLVK